MTSETQLSFGQSLVVAAICNAESEIATSLPDSALQPLPMVFEIIGKERAKVLELRTQMGLHRLETDKTRFERWEITQAKLFALDTVRDALSGSLPIPPNPGFGFRTLSLELSSLREVVFQLRGVLLSRGDSPSLSRADLALESVEWIQKTLSGSAGTQPLTSEETPEPMGNPPVTVPASNLPQWFDSLSVADLHSISELALEAMERRPGAEYEWNVADRFADAVGRR